MDERFLKRVRRNDRIARWLIHLFGVGVILMVFLILFVILSTAMPLFSPTRVTEGDPQQSQVQGVMGAGFDEYQETGYVIDDRGNFRFLTLSNGAPIDVLSTGVSSGRLVRADWAGQDRFHLLWEDGSAAVTAVSFAPKFGSNQVRVIEHRLKTEARWPATPGVGQTVGSGGDVQLRIDLLDSGDIRLRRVEESEDFLGNVTKTEDTATFQPTSRVDRLLLSRDGRILVAAGGRHLYRWDLKKFKRPTRTNAVHTADITAIGFVNGDVSIVVGDDQGGVSTYMMTEQDLTDEEREDYGRRAVPIPRELRLIHTLRKHASPVRSVVTAQRNKTIVTASEAGVIHADYMTSERPLGGDLKAGGAVRGLSFAARNNGILACREDGTLLRWDVRQPHPEISFKTLFGKVHYENFAKPEFEWQSSSGDNTHEPKLSLMPLISGTLKATLFAMLFAIPLAVLGALYTSQFMRPGLRNMVKPTVEIMAAVPSVVVGFMAAYWLAPILVRHMPTLFLSFVCLPLVLVGVVIAWRNYGLRAAPGIEFLLLIPVLVVGLMISVWVGGLVESTFMVVDYYPNGNFAQWLANTFMTPLDPRNAILIAFALGFAVMPIIFTLADDALTAVPRGLSAASLALGASRWQTAWKVVLPSASPGIFAAVMIGFGRAIGETMIVLMAAGGIAVMGFNPFNGMRTLSANLATEVPEAAAGSTHYRVLFLSAVLLFVMTFCANTVAEVVRIRLRKKYGNY